uniref:Uncharacterized protein n=1 Tax=viral metagenome TaxID=1070528 RepID=A0A6M3L5F2_9ZZZZ
MAPGREIILFHKGLAFDSLSALQQPGFLRTCENISLEVEGKQTLRPFFANINTTAIGPIHSVKKHRGLLLVGDGKNLRASGGSGDFTNLYSILSGDILSFAPYKNFICAFNGTNFYLIDQSKNTYPAVIANPTIAPTLADSGAGTGPSGHYMGYISFLITWPNGHTYETGLSPASADLNITDNTITWSGIQTCSYSATYGATPTIHRKLYRGPGTGGTLGDIYYVATIADNTTTTYSDSLSDATLSTNAACLVDDYGPTQIPKYLAWHYGRAFIITKDNPHRLYYSEVAGGDTSGENEVIYPLAALQDNWDDLRVSGFDYVDPQGIYSWGVNLYIPTKETWIRKQGNDPDTWAYRKTYATQGIGAPYSVDFCSTPGGLIGVTSPEAGEPGIAVFGGQTSDIFSSPKLDWIFKSHMNLDYIHKCRGKIAGRYYHLLYPSGTATEPNTHLAIDLRRFPDFRVAHWSGLDGVCLDVDKQGTKFYLGTSSGYVKTGASAGSGSLVVETHDLIGGDPTAFNEIKTWKQLKYSLKGTVTLEVYLNNSLMKWPDDSTSKVLTGTGEDVQVCPFPENAKGYKIRLKLTGTDLTEFELYSPWMLLFD